MNSIVRMLNGLNLLWTFVVLLAAHLLLYYVQGTDDWIIVAVSAAAVDTAVLGALQFVVRSQSKNRY